MCVFKLVQIGEGKGLQMIDCLFSVILIQVTASNCNTVLLLACMRGNKIMLHLQSHWFLSMNQVWATLIFLWVYLFLHSVFHFEEYIDIKENK